MGRLWDAHTGNEADAHVAGVPLPPTPNGPYSHSYRYDQYGNMNHRVGWGGWNEPYRDWLPQYANNRLVTNLNTGAPMTYDAAGNLTGDGTSTYQYNAQGQQTKTVSPGNTFYQSYDGDGLRVKKVEYGQATYYLRSSILGNQVIGEFNSSGQMTRGYVYLGGQMLAIQQGNAVRWVAADPVTKSQRVTDQNGNSTTSIDLDPWGGETNRGYNQAFQPHRFATYERDANGGDEAMARRYEGKWMTFAQPDPYRGSYDLTDPQSFNRYSYTQNDPVNFTDPSGLEPTLACTNADGGPWQCDPFGGFYASEGGPPEFGGVIFPHEPPDRPGREPGDPQKPVVPVLPEQKYNDCAKKLGNSPAPGYGQALSILWASALDKVDPTLLAVTWAAEAIPPFNFWPVSNYRPDDGGWDVGPLQASTTYYNKSPYTDGLDNPFGTVFSESEPFNGNSFSSLRVGARAYALDILPRSKNRADAAGLYRAGNRKNPAKSGYNDRVKQFNNWSKGYDAFFNCLKK